ncbi:MAG: C1 family peptidase [Planctomycetota bacterium]
MNYVARIGLVLLLATCQISAGQDEPPPESAETGYGFVNDELLSATSVKNQAKTNTCWCFSTNSFLEAELIRMGKAEVDLSEMFVVRNVYPLKADRFVRLHGNGRFAGGGLFANVMHVFRDYGAVPESVYPGRADDRVAHNHYEMDAVLKGMLDTLIKRDPPHNPAWKTAFAGVLDAYLGKVPDEFEFEGQTYTARSFADSLGIRPDDYFQFTSYLHHPFYREVVLEVPDNWAGDRYWNVPIDELMRMTRQAVESGYSVAWDGDVSEKVCNLRKGIAVWPAKGWSKMTAKERTQLFEKPGTEVMVSPEYRQRRFDEQTSTDDHLMHIVGLSHDRKGSRYFVVKDSYGERNPFKGVAHMSEAYMRCQTVAILLHRDAIPPEIAEKIGLVSKTAAK